MGQNLIPRCCFLFTPAIYPGESTFVSRCGSTPVEGASRCLSSLGGTPASLLLRGLGGIEDPPPSLYAPLFPLRPPPFPLPSTPPHPSFPAPPRNLSSCLPVFLALRHSLMPGSCRPLACTAAAAPCTLARLLAGSELWRAYFLMRWWR